MAASRPVLVPSVPGFTVAQGRKPQTRFLGPCVLECCAYPFVPGVSKCVLDRGVAALVEVNNLPRAMFLGTPEAVALDSTASVPYQRWNMVVGSSGSIHQVGTAPGMTHQTGRPSKDERLGLSNRWLAGLFLLIVGICAGLLLGHSAALLPYDGPNDAGVGNISFAALRFARGGPIYARLNQPPYALTLYSPLFYMSLAALDRVTSPSTFQVFVFEGRAFVFVTYLLIALVVYLWARRFCVRQWIAWAAPLLVLADGSFYPFVASLRPDFPALLFSLLGFFLISAESDLSWPHATGAGFLMGLAFLFKQPFLAAPAAAACWLLWKRRYRLVGLLTAAALLPVIITIGWLELRGEPVMYSLLFMRHGVYDVSGEFKYIGLLLVADPTLALQTALALAGLWRIAKLFPRQARPISTYLILAAAIALGTMVQAGAARYYLIQTTSLCAMLAPAGLESWLEWLETRRSDMRMGAALVLLGLPTLALLPWRGIAKPPSYYPLVSALATYHVLSDNPYVAVQGKNPELIDLWTNALFERSGQWSSALLEHEIEAQQFDYIVGNRVVTGPGRAIFPWTYRGIASFSLSVMQRIDDNYRLAGTCMQGLEVVFVPKLEPRGGQLTKRLAPVCGWQ